MSGKVYLVGAGPGDAGLLTVKGREVLEQADVVVCDALVGAAVRGWIPAGARCIDAGKRAGNHSRSQDEINEILWEEARAGRTVVRLQGGDPFLFGRGGEELALLEARGVDYEVVPGVSSALAVPAYGGIPVTHRGLASSLHIFTAHRQGDGGLALDFPALARLEGTLVFLMGLSVLPALCRGLVDAGMDPATPAAAVSRGTTAAQRTVRAALADLPAAARALEAPAVIVVGRVCGLSFPWAARLPLSGRRFVLPAPRGRGSILAERLRALGAEAVEYPTVALRPRRDVDLSGLDDCRWLAFTSPSGVDIFWALLERQRRDVRSLARLQVAALGAGTAAALARHGVFADLVPARYDAESLGRALAERLAPGERVFLARAAAGSPALTDGLPPGAWLDAPIYDTVLECPALPAPADVLAGNSWVMATSGSAVRGLAAALGEAALAGVPALCIGAQTAAQAARYGMRTRVAREATLDCLVELALACSNEEEETWN